MAFVLALAFLLLPVYEDFYALISAPEVFHEVEITTSAGGTIRITVKFSGINDTLVFITPVSAFWDELGLELTAREPARRV